MRIDGPELGGMGKAMGRRTTMDHNGTNVRDMDGLYQYGMDGLYYVSLWVVKEF